MIIIATMDSDGIIGFVLNKKYSRYFDELVEFSSSPALPLYEGGPLEHEKLFFLHQRPDIIKDGIALNSHLFYGGDFRQAVLHLNMGTLHPSHIRILIGYCGWDAGQLEEEINTGEWELLDEYKVF